MNINKRTLNEVFVWCGCVGVVGLPTILTAVLLMDHLDTLGWSACIKIFYWGASAASALFLGTILYALHYFKKK